VPGECAVTADHQLFAHAHVLALDITDLNGFADLVQRPKNTEPMSTPPRARTPSLPRPFLKLALRVLAMIDRRTAAKAVVIQRYSVPASLEQLNNSFARSKARGRVAFEVRMSTMFCRRARR
jgi:hypothetical protein